MINKEKFTQHIKDLSTRELVSKVLDKIEIVIKNHEIKYTDFLNPYEQKSVIEVTNAFPELKVSSFGGYLESERKVLAIYQDYLTPELIEKPIAAIEIKTIAEQKISHRDVLGSALGLGIKREKVGDILIHEDYFQIIVNKSLEDFIIFNLNKIGKVEVEAKSIDFNKVKPVEAEYKSIVGFLASLRLDAVVSFAFKISRSEAQSLIGKERVTVNWEQIPKNDYIIDTGDIITLRGKGRAKIEEIGGRTKSDRIKVVIKKLI